MKTAVLGGPGLGGALGVILEVLEELWALFWTQEGPKFKNRQKSDLVTLPQGTHLGAQFSEEIDLALICLVFLRVF